MRADVCPAKFEEANVCRDFFSRSLPVNITSMPSAHWRWLCGLVVAALVLEIMNSRGMTAENLRVAQLATFSTPIICHQVCYGNCRTIAQKRYERETLVDRDEKDVQHIRGYYTNVRLCFTTTVVLIVVPHNPHRDAWGSAALAVG